MDDLFPFIRLPMTIEQFFTLPQNPAYKYEYFDGEAVLSARPKTYDAVLDLGAKPPGGELEVWDERVRVRPLRESDWDEFPRLFSASFHRVQPFAAMSDERRLEAARKCLDRTREAKDGPIVFDACRVAVRETDEEPIAAALITLQKTFDDTDLADPSPATSTEEPHLTWIFVPPMLARNGIGSALLASVVDGLLAAGYSRLFSTFLLGNESSTLWHWRNGFRLLGYLGSPRRWRAKRPRAGEGGGSERGGKTQ